MPGTATDEPVDRIPRSLVTGLLAGTVFLTLLAAFSPSWISFRSWHRAPEVFQKVIEVRRANSVKLQVENPMSEIPDKMHKIVRFRLLVPAIGHVLHLPPDFVLAISHIGCLFTLGFLVRIGRTRGQLSWTESALMAIVAGAGSWFFTSMGWLGYYDALLALALLAVAFSPGILVPTIASLLTPWVDERFFVALPLAMLTRWLIDGVALGQTPAWLKRQSIILAPPVLVYLPLRLWLVGQYGSPTMAQYTGDLGILGESLPRILFGMWSGLRVGWILVIAAIVVLYRRKEFAQALLLATGVAATCIVGVCMANDHSRSMAMALPVVPLGWILLRRSYPSERITASWILAGLALLLPAHQVVSTFDRPVNTLWYELHALEKPPQLFDPATYIQQAAYASQANHPLDAQTALSLALQLEPKAKDLDQVARLLTSWGRLNEARVRIDEAISLDASKAEFWSDRAGIRERLGDTSGAAEDRVTAARLAPPPDD